MSKICFAGEIFDDLYPDPEGGIPIIFRIGPRGLTVRAGLQKGRTYTPGAHPYTVTVTVSQGSGLFFLGEQVHRYEPESVFEVGKNVPHSFIKVERDTIFVKDFPVSART